MNNFDIYQTITNNKHFSYKVKMAIVLLPSDKVYDILKEYGEFIREGVPTAILQSVLQDEIYETKAWYIPDELKIWDRRFGELSKNPFLTFDDDTETWAKILQFSAKVSVPNIEEYSSKASYHRDWGYFAEVLAISQKNHHPLFLDTYNILISKGLPIKVFEKKVMELQKYTDCICTNTGIEHFCRIKKW